MNIIVDRSDYTLKRATLSIEGQTIRCVAIVVNKAFSVGDRLNFGLSFAEDIYDNIYRDFLTQSISIFKKTIEYTTVSYTTAKYRFYTDFSSGSNYAYISCYLTYDNRPLGVARSNAGQYRPEHILYTSPMFMITDGLSYYHISGENLPSYFYKKGGSYTLIDGIPFSNTTGDPYDFKSNTTFTISAKVNIVFDSIKLDDLSSDPYSQGGVSVGGGGTGTFSSTGDNIAIPSLPTLSAVDTGFVTLFNPTLLQLKSLSNYMWNGDFNLDQFKKIYANPMDCIISLSVVPVAVPNLGAKDVNIGNISTGISMNVASTQYVIVDCGTLNIEEYWGAYLDYDPYTKIELYLPYIGTHAISTDDVMGKSVHVVYHVDILTGACTAYVSVNNTVLYSFNGQCSMTIPVSSLGMTNIVNGIISIASSIGMMVATGGSSAPMGIANIASTAVNSLKPNVEKSGSMSGVGGMLAVQTPYIIVTRPRQAVPSQQNKLQGLPSFITYTLGTLKGYTIVDSIHLRGLTATNQEKQEIETLLKSGVII